MSDYKIYQCVPIPPKRWMRFRCEAAFLAMEPDNCMVIAPGAVLRMRDAFRFFLRGHPQWKFTTRQLDDGGLGIWLVRRPKAKPAPAPRAVPAFDEPPGREFPIWMPA